ncbi:MAG: radical SAM protein [Desulfobacteraceae bacterium]|nr:MAG: radical SAM protein [Desulfobacteraceae bacterium]
MKIILINPPHPYLIKPYSQAPLGLLYLASVLRDTCCEVELHNLSGFTEDQSLNILPLDADVYGFSATSVDYPLCERMASAIRRKNDRAKLLIGGPHATVAPETIDLSVFHSACIGEGEKAVLEMVEDIRENRLEPFYRKPRIRSLDELPLPARDLIDSIGGEVFAFDRNYSDSNLSATIMTSRGCPFNCSYCASKPMWRGLVSYRSVESVLEEIRIIRDEFSVDQFRFCDDTLNMDTERLHHLCRGLDRMKVFWRCSVRAGLSTPDDFKMMFDSGCREISPGIESGDQRVLNFLHKHNSVESNRDLINWATRAGINVRVLLMTGTPGECSDTPEKTRDFLGSIDFNMVSLTQFRPIPGSPIWKTPEKFHCRILDRDMEHYSFYTWRKGDNGEREKAPIQSVIETDLLPKEALEDNMRRMFDYAEETGKLNRG